MTAPGCGGADEIREQMAAALLLGSGGRQYWDPEELRDIVNDLLPIVQALIAAAEERGRQSVGLGDFMPGGCDEEVRAPNYHFTETYGDWLECTRRKGHDGDHEHEDSGLTWPRALDGTP